MKKELSPEAKKRCEELVSEIAQYCCCLGPSCSGCYRMVKNLIERGYQAGYNDLDRQKLLEECEKILSKARLLEMDRVYESLGCPSLEGVGGVRVETIYDEILEKLKAARGAT